MKQIVAETWNFVYVRNNFLIYGSQIFKLLESVLFNLLSLEWCKKNVGSPGNIACARHKDVYNPRLRLWLDLHNLKIFIQ